MVVWRRAAGFGLARLFARPAAARLLHLRDLIHHAAACSAPPGTRRCVTGEHDIRRAVEPGGFRVAQFFLLPSAWRKSTVQKVRRASEHAWPNHCTPEFTRWPLPRLGAGASVGMTYFLHTEARISMPGARWPHMLCCAARCVARVSPRTLHKKHRTVCDVAAGPCLHVVR